MHAVVFAPVVLSLMVVALSRIGINRLAPRAAAWAVTVSAVAMAVTLAGAVVLIACPLPARVPFIASLGRWQPQSIAATTPVPGWLSAVALIAGAVLAVRVVLELRRIGQEMADLVAAQAELAGRGPGEVVVVDSPDPSAHAVSRTLTRRGRIVLTSGMLELLDGEERAAVVAHERSHLRHGHSVFVAAVRLSLALNPLLTPLRDDLHFALERWADDDAAAVTHPSVVASAVAKAALSMRELATATLAPSTLHLHTHAVVARVSALLREREERSHLAWALIATAALAAASLAWSMHDTERFFEAVRLVRRS
jgi:hypothetical protein